MPIEVKMAKLSPTMESGQMVKWLVKVGDQVKEGDTLAEIQTDKAVMPMESFEEGIVARLDVKEGDEIALGQRVLVLAKKGEDPKVVAETFGGDGAQAPGPKASAEAVAKASSSPSPSAAEPTGGAVVEDNGQGPAEGRRVRASPLARKIAAEAGVDLTQVRGSGPGGRIIRDDVAAFIDRGPSKPAAPAAAAPTAPGAPTAARPSAPAPAQGPAFPPPAEKRIPHARMRKTIAERMLQAKAQTAEIHVTMDIRLDRVVSMREALNKGLAAEGIKLSIGDFVTRAVALALRKHPALNASYEADAIVQHGRISLGIAVALENGLIVPVLHDADRMGLREIRLGTQALTEAARANKLTPQQLMGSTFTISNLGMYGVRQFDAIINMPEVAILAVGAAEQRPVVEGGQLAVGWVMSVTLTADHRAVDGATAAEFLRTLKGLLEEPASMLL